MRSAQPHSQSALVTFLSQRIQVLKPRKTQAEIAFEAGFQHANVLAMIKKGTTKLPLDRVPALAKALEVDTAYLLRLTLEQTGMTGPVYDDIFGKIVTHNELGWIEELRLASGNTDPRITSKGRAALQGVFGK